MRKLVAIDSPMMGPEPSWAVEPNNPKEAFLRSLNWYNYSFGRKEAKEFFIDYLKSVGRSKDEIELAKSIPDTKIPAQFGWIARMMCVGFKPDDKTKEFFTQTYKRLIALTKKNQVKEPIEQIEESTDVGVVVPKATIQERISDKAREEAGELEGLIDDFVASGCKMQFDLDSYVKSKKLSSVVLNKICDIFVNQSKRLQDDIASNDPQVKEGYSNFTRAELRKLKDFIDGIVAATNKGAVDSKPVRKARKKKEKPAAVLASKALYLIEDKETGLKSIHPEKIIGASQVWVYNVKTRTLGVYFSNDARGLTIKGTTILNFKEDISIGKKLRKPKETLDDLMNFGKVKLKQLLVNLSTKEAPLTGRLNSDTIIAKVVN